MFWDLVELPEEKSYRQQMSIQSRTGVDGLIEHYKVRLITQSFSQKYGDDDDEAFCPVVRLESLHVLIALAVQHGLKLHQVDVTTAFLNGELEEEVYMRQPEGFVTQGEEHLLSQYKYKQNLSKKYSTRCRCQLKHCRCQLKH